MFGISVFAYDELATALLVWSNLNQSNRRSAVQCTLPYGECSLVSEKEDNVFVAWKRTTPVVYPVVFMKLQNKRDST